MLRPVLVFALILTVAGCGGGDSPPAADAPSDQPTAESVAVVDPPTEEPATAEPEPTDEPTEIPATEVPAEPIHLEGSGQTATDTVAIPFPVAIASFTHGGQRNFIVKAFLADGSEDLMVNKQGNYAGQALLAGVENVTFDVNADGNWTIDIAPVGKADGAPFSGQGDMVSGIFDPPASGPWEFTHDGKRNFIVKAVCGGGTDLVQNEQGPVAGSGMVKFGDGPCLWTVQADGNWTLAPRQ